MAGEKVTVYIRGESGTVKAHDLPLPWGVQDRLDKGQVVEVDGPDDKAALTAPENSPIVAAAEAEREEELAGLRAELARVQAALAEAEKAAPAEPESEDEKPDEDEQAEPLKRPAVNDPKDAWAAYARSVDPDLTVDDTNAMTKAQLIDRY